MELVETDRNNSKQILGILAAVIIAAVGIAGVICGGVDASPGGQLLSALSIVGAVWLGVRSPWNLQRCR